MTHDIDCDHETMPWHHEGWLEPTEKKYIKKNKKDKKINKSVHLPPLKNFRRGILKAAMSLCPGTDSLVVN